MHFRIICILIPIVFFSCSKVQQEENIQEQNVVQETAIELQEELNTDNADIEERIEIASSTDADYAFTKKFYVRLQSSPTHEYAKYSYTSDRMDLNAILSIQKQTAYEDKNQYIDTNAPWYFVRTKNNEEGWIHGSNIHLANDFIITWEDPVVAHTAREALGTPKGPLYYSDILTIKELHLTGDSILDGQASTLADLEYFKNLEKLSVFSYKISDLRPLSNLPLRELRIDNDATFEWRENTGAANNFTPLSNITTLEKLSLRNIYRFIDELDCSPLASLVNVEELEITGQFFYTDFLKSLVNLKTFYTDNTNIRAEDFAENTAVALIIEQEKDDPQESSNAIQSLEGDYEIVWQSPPVEKKVREILSKYNEPITKSDVEKITSLNMTGGSLTTFDITTLDDLQHFSNLEGLWVRSSEISDLSPLINLPLKDLHIFNQYLMMNDGALGNLKDITPITAIKTLERLTLHMAFVVDLSALAELPNIHTLFLQLPADDFSILSTIKTLKNLYTCGYGPDDTSIFPAELHVSDANFFEAGIVRATKPFEVYSVPSNKDFEINWKDAFIEKRVRDALQKPTGPIMYSDALTVSALNLYSGILSNEITSISDLQYLKNLRHLWIKSNRIENLELLSTLPLVELEIDNYDMLIEANGNLENIWHLHNMTMLKTLHIQNANVENLEPLDALKSFYTTKDNVTLEYNAAPLFDFVYHKVNTPEAILQDEKNIQHVLNALEYNKGMLTLPNVSSNGKTDYERLKEMVSVSLNAHDYDSNTPVTIAAELGYFEIVKALIEAGANINEVGRHNYTALLFSLNPPVSQDIATYLIDSGADVNAIGYRNKTPIMFAANYPEILTMLIAKGADVNAETGYTGECALENAVELKNIESITLLIEAGADVISGYGEDSMGTMEAAYGNEEILSILRNAPTYNIDRFPTYTITQDSSPFLKDASINSDVVTTLNTGDVVVREFFLSTKDEDGNILIPVYSKTLGEGFILEKNIERIRP